MRESELPILVIPEILTIFEFDESRIQLKPVFREINQSVQDWRLGRRPDNPYSHKQKQWLALHYGYGNLDYLTELHRPEIVTALS